MVELVKSLLCKLNFFFFLNICTCIGAARGWVAFLSCPWGSAWLLFLSAFLPAYNWCAQSAQTLRNCSFKVLVAIGVCRPSYIQQTSVVVVLGYLYVDGKEVAGSCDALF